jgi:hypothetical protein
MTRFDAAFDPDHVIADLDGRLWVLRRTTPRDADRRATYDVIDRHGAIVDRVRVPVGTTVLGFGRSVVYTTQQTAGGIRILRGPIR